MKFHIDIRKQNFQIAIFKMCTCKNDFLSQSSIFEINAFGLKNNWNVNTYLNQQEDQNTQF